MAKRSGSSKRQVRITDADFDEFNRLHAKATRLAFLIQDEVGQNLDLVFSGVSELVPTSGAIWLRWATQKQPPETACVYGAFLEVTFTHDGIRIGLNFGSRAHKPKQKYYEMLRERKLEEEIKALFELDKQYFLSKVHNYVKPLPSYPGYCFYDTLWYYHTRNVREVSWYGESRTGWMLSRVGKIRDVEEAAFPYFLPYHEPHPLIAYVIEKALEELQQQDKKPMTGHKLLIGRVIKRDSEEFSKVLGNIVNEIVNTFRELCPILARIEVDSKRI